MSFQAQRGGGLDLTRTWVASDHHWGHKRIIDKAERDYETLEDMNNSLRYRWNNIVDDDDVVYYLGDMFWNRRTAKEILPTLTGRIHLVLGNHDKNWIDDISLQRQLVWVKHYHELKIRVGGERQLIVMCHYPFLTWNTSGYGSWNLHGHCHGKLKGPPSTRFDVSIDAHESHGRELGQLFSLAEIAELLSGRSPPRAGDHHH